MSRRPTPPSKTVPLPIKDGIDPVALILPKAGESPEEAHRAQPRRPYDIYGATTVLDYMVARFYPHDEAVFRARFDAREVKDRRGQDVAPDDPLVGQKIWYYRQLAHEKPVPTDLPVLFEDEHIIAVDKPHFLPTTPNGSYLANTALTFLRVREGNPNLVPAHRLDRLTAGVVIFVKTPEARAPFQLMFEHRAISKSYEAVAPALDDHQPGETFEVKTHIQQKHGQRTVTQFSEKQALAMGKAINAHTRITPLAEFPNPKKTSIGNAVQETKKLAHYLLEPVTGKTHQLRAHLNYLGAPIVNDVLYPHDLGFIDDDFHRPLQLLCREMSFVHPVTGKQVRIESKRQLLMVADPN